MFLPPVRHGDNMQDNIKKRIYADNAATTPVLPEVVEAMLPVFYDNWGNPSSLHENGQLAGRTLEAARATAAGVLGCKPEELYFTSCGTESDNWAIKGAAYAAKGKKNKIITSKIEHHAVLNTCGALEKDGFEVKYIGVDKDGLLDLDELRRKVDERTAIVAIIMANNEIGTIQPIAEVAEIAHKAGALCFTDAVQAVGSIPIDLSKLGVDMLSLSGHKFGAPKGIGALYIKKGVRIRNLLDGGGHEQGKRSGTENLPYIVGLARALEIARERMDDMKRVAALRDR